MAPLVSVVIDNYNYERFLRRSIDSALGQTYSPVEVVVVDDASTDGSAAVISSYGAALVPVLKARNAGHGAAFNSGFQASRGEIVLFLDADDYLYPDAVETVVGSWQEGVALVQYRLDLLDPSGRKVDLYPAPELAFDSGDVVPLLLSRGRFRGTITSGNAFSRAVLERILPMPEHEFRQGGDGYLVTVAPLFGPVRSIERPLGAYCQHGINHSAFSRHLAERARWAIEHDAARHRALAARAAEFGLSVLPGAALRDTTHVEARLVSLFLEPERHPDPSDSLRRLALQGARSLRHSRMPKRRKALLAAWFLSVGFLPRTLARPALRWRWDMQSRPRTVARIARAIARTAPRGL